MEFVENGISHFGCGECGAIAGDIAGPVSGFENVADCGFDGVGFGVEVKGGAEEHCGGEDGGERVGNILPGDIRC